MKGSSRSQSQLEIWYREAVRSNQRLHLRRYLQARGHSDPKITKWGMKQERWDPVPIIEKKALLSTTEWRTPKRGSRISDRQQHRGRQWHGSWATLLKILQLVPVALCLLLKVGMLAMAWNRKETAAIFTIQSILTLKRTWKEALIHEFEENHGFMVFSSMPMNIDMKMIRSSNFSRSMFLRLTSSWHSRSNSNDVGRGRVFHSNSVGSPSIPWKLFRNCCLNFHQLSFPSHRRFCWFRNFLKTQDGICQWLLHSESRHNFPAPTSEQCWTNTWSLPHKRSWTFCCSQHLSVQDEQLLSLKMTWIIPYQHVRLCRSELLDWWVRNVQLFL